MFTCYKLFITDINKELFKKFSVNEDQLGIREELLRKTKYKQWAAHVTVFWVDILHAFKYHYDLFRTVFIISNMAI